MATGGFVANVLLMVVLLAPALSAGAGGPAASEQAVTYKIARTIDGTKEGQGIFLIVSIAPEDFTRDRMTQLARQLNQDFAGQPKVDVSIFDSETVANNVVPAGAHYVDFKAAERGIYHLDRAKGVEYITFSSKPGRPANEIKINLGRTRAKRKKTT